MILHEDVRVYTQSHKRDIHLSNKSYLSLSLPASDTLYINSILSEHSFRPNGSFICPNDLLIRQNDFFMLSNESFICLNESFICSNDSFICSNDLLIRSNESFNFSNDSFICSNNLLICPNESFICSNDKLTLFVRTIYLFVRTNFFYLASLHCVYNTYCNRGVQVRLIAS